jgi:hypothetical protein
MHRMPSVVTWAALESPVGLAQSLVATPHALSRQPRYMASLLGSGTVPLRRIATVIGGTLGGLRLPIAEALDPTQKEVTGRSVHEEDVTPAETSR